MRMTFRAKKKGKWRETSINFPDYEYDGSWCYAVISNYQLQKLRRLGDDLEVLWGYFWMRAYTIKHFPKWDMPEYTCEVDWCGSRAM